MRTAVLSVLPLAWCLSGATVTAVGLAALHCWSLAAGQLLQHGPVSGSRAERQWSTATAALPQTAFPLRAQSRLQAPIPRFTISACRLPSIFLEGPFGAPAMHHARYDTLVLAATGVG